MIDSSSWAGLRLIEPMTEGNRNEVWRASLGSTMVVVKRSRRSAASLDWELDLMSMLEAVGFRVPTVFPADDGRRVVDGVIVQRWLDGREPTSEADWRLVADELSRLHRATVGHGQRPGCANVLDLITARRSVDADLDRMPAAEADEVLAVFAEFADVATAVIHGDPMAGNVRIGDTGSVGLLDWDESRVDLVWHDLSNLGIRVLDEKDHRRAQRLSNAWEAANGWVVEPDYARRRLAALRERKSTGTSAAGRRPGHGSGQPRSR